MRTLTLACYPYDRTRALLDGRVGVEDARIVPIPIASEESFPRAHGRAEFDVSELSLSSYLLQVGRGESPYVAIPVFVSRAFRHGAIYLRRDADIQAPRNLEGRRVGVPEYQMTLALWVRGILADDYGVATDSFLWRTAGTNVAGRKERLPLTLPPHLEVAPLPSGATLNAALLAGDLDAVFSPTPPDAFTSGDPGVVRLFPDPRTAEIAYYRRTGYHPIMHVIGIRRDVLAREPDLARRLYKAFAEARRIGLGEMARMTAASAPPLMLPWLAEAWEETQAVLGHDPWPYGIAANRGELETVCRWSSAQHLSPQPLSVEEIFAPATLET